jgi:hypothetical protein
MSTLATLRATTRPGDFGWAVACAMVGLIAGLVHGSASPDELAKGGAHFGLVTFAAALLMLRYQFLAAPAALFWFDAMRQGVPGVTRASIRAEAIRLAIFLGVLLLPMATAGWLLGGVPALAPIPAAIGVSLAAAGFGALAAVISYRHFLILSPVAVLIVLAIWGGLLPDRGLAPVLIGLAVFVSCGALIGRRLQRLVADGADPAVGGDYAFIFSLGRHDGSAFTAPNSAPLAVLLDERRGRTRQRTQAVPTDLDARVRTLLGEPAWQLTTAPMRAARQWLLLIGAYAVLMMAFFAAQDHLHGDTHPFVGRASMLLLLLVVTWGFSMNGMLHEQLIRPLRASRTGGDGLDAELRLLPGVAAPRAVWARRLRPLWLPYALAMGAVAVGLALIVGVAPIGVAVLALIATLEGARMRLATWAALDGDRAAQQWLNLAGIANGLLLTVALPAWVYGLAPSFDQMIASGLASWGLSIGRLLALAGLPILFLALAARALRMAAPSSALLRPAPA